jgi:hypothetical protein
MRGFARRIPLVLLVILLKEFAQPLLRPGRHFVADVRRPSPTRVVIVDVLPNATVPSWHGRLLLQLAGRMGLQLVSWFLGPGAARPIRSEGAPGCRSPAGMRCRGLVFGD